MSIDALLTRYALYAQSQGLSAKTIRHVRLSITQLDRFLGGIADVRTVTEDDLRRFIVAEQKRPKWQGREQQSKQNISPSAIASYTRGIKQFFKWATEAKVLGVNPVAGVRPPKTPKLLPKLLPDEAILKVLDTVKDHPREKAMFLLYLDTGVRLSELSKLMMADVDLKSGAIKVFGKGAKERIVHVCPATRLAIETYLVDRPEPVREDKLFLRADGYQLAPARIEKLFEGVGKAAGLNHRLGVHVIRHTFATKMLRNGASFEDVRIALGHEQVSTTQIYAHLTDVDVAEAHRRFSPVANLPIWTRQSNGRYDPRRRRPVDPAEVEAARKLHEMAPNIF